MRMRNGLIADCLIDFKYFVRMVERVVKKC